jgi:hypothetical protein
MRSACAPRSSGRTSPVGVCRKYGSTHSSGWPAASGATATSISENASTSGSGPSSLGLFSGRASHASAGIPTALHIASSSTSRRPSFRARIELADSSKLPPLWMFLRTQSSSLRTRATWLSLVSGEPCAGTGDFVGQRGKLSRHAQRPKASLANLVDIAFQRHPRADTHRR